jgi:hypothetical protein
MGHLAEAFGEDAIMPAQCRLAVDITGGANLGCNLAQGNLFTEKLIVLVMKVMDDRIPLTDDLAGMMRCVCRPAPVL